MKAHSRELEVALRAVKAGAAISESYYDQDIEYILKPDKSVVTKADVDSEKIIIEEITNSFPKANFLAEESGGHTNHDEFWIVDPIDGTRSFSRGVPTWNVLLALCRNKEIVLGVSYYPVLDLLIYAERGKGAFVNGHSVHVSKTASLEKSYVGMGSPRYFVSQDLMSEIVEKAATVRIYDMNYTNAMVAKGSMECLVDAYGKTWDLAPYKVIIEEAGGRITRLDGTEWAIDDNRGGIVSNGLIHEELIDITRKYY